MKRNDTSIATAATAKAAPSANRAHVIEREKAKYERGECRSCTKPREPDITLCADHKRERLEYNRRIRTEATAKRRAAQMATAKRPWTKADDDVIMQCRKLAMTGRQIAAKLGRSPGALAQRIHRLETDETLGDGASDDGSGWRDPYPPLRIEDFMRSGGSASGL